MKKVLTYLLSMSLVAALAVAGTLAYLTSEDSDVNVMTMGNVTIEQFEKERDENGKLVDFTQAKPAYPAVYTNGSYAWEDAYQTWEEVGAPGSNQLFDDSMKNVVDKMVFVKNTGRSDAYYRTLIAIESPDEFDSDKIHLNLNGNSRFEHNSSFGDEASYVEINGTRYFVYEMLYNEVLTPNEVSRPSLLQLYLDPLTTNEDCALFGETWDVLVLSQAVQTEGFNDAATALDTAFGEVSEENVQKWFKDTKVPVVVETQDDEKFSEALAKGEDLLVGEKVDIIEVQSSVDGEYSVDGKGSTVTMNGVGNGNYGYLGFVPGTGEDATVSNVNVTGSGFVEVGHYGMGGGDYTVNKLTITDLTTTVGVPDGANKVAPAFCHYGSAVLTDCIMTGANTKVEGHKAYDIGFVNGTKTTIEGGKYGAMYLWSQAHVTIYDAEVDTIDSSAITTKNLGMLTIGAGTHVGTINLVPAGTYTPALTIEEGAIVDAITYKGVTYTQAEWLAR